MLKKVVLIVLSVILFSPTANADGVSFFGWTDIYYDSPIWSKYDNRIYFIKNVKHSGPSFALAGPPEEIRKLECYIMSMQPDGSDKKILAKFITIKGSLKYVSDLAILPTGKELIFYLLSNKDEDSGIYKINANIMNLVKVVNFLVGGGLPTYFYLSPDAKKIAYTKCEFLRDGYSGQWYSSWLVGISGQDNYMICGEESEVKGWTKDGKIIIDAYVDIEGNPSPRFNNKGQYKGGLKSKYLLYDLLSMRLIKEIPQEFGKIELMPKEDTTISLDGGKKIFWDRENLGVMDIDGKNKKILLKGKKR